MYTQTDTLSLVIYLISLIVIKPFLKSSCNTILVCLVCSDIISLDNTSGMWQLGSTAILQTLHPYTYCMNYAKCL